MMVVKREIFHCLGKTKQPKPTKQTNKQQQKHKMSIQKQAGERTAACMLFYPNPQSEK